MNIVVNCRFLTQKISGTQRFAIELSRRIKVLVPDAVFVSPRNIIHSDLAAELNVKVIGKLSGFLWEQIELPKYLYFSGSPLLLNFSTISPVLYKNSVASILDLSFKFNPSWFSSSFSFAYNLLVPIIARRSRLIITISKYSLEDILKHYKVQENKVLIVYPAVSDHFLSKVDKKVEVKDYGKYILAVSSLDPRKNFKNLILGFKKLEDKSINLVIVGSKNKVFADESFEKIIINTSNIHFTGYVSDEELKVLYQNALAFAYPSFFEGFGIPPLEAMACSCPTVVSNVTSLPEVCGDASVYVNPYDVDDISYGLATIVADSGLRQSLVQRGFTRLQHFSWDKSADLLVSKLFDLKYIN